jgi:ABC-type sugar transport system substrate-binding protein
MKRLVVAVIGLLLALPVMAMSVVFLNPGKSDEAFWLISARAMQQAAKSLDVQLEVLFAERQPLRTLELARGIIARPVNERPEYVIITNDYATGPALLRLFDATGIKVFMAYSGISEAADRVALGLPRERFKNWLGSLEPHAEDAGYLTAKKLIETGRKSGAVGADGKLHLMVIGGDRSTPTSIRRNAGMHRAISEAPDVVLDQEVFAGWTREKAAEQSVWLYQRYPGTRLIWAGNDLMAFGAMDSWEKRGGKAGVDAWFSGVNTSREALESVKSGRLSALAGGHFIAGAWSLVLIHDYHHGRDFADEGLELEQPMFALFTPKLADRFLVKYGDMRFDQVDFRRFSKTLNPALKRYDFSFEQLLR